MVKWVPLKISLARPIQTFAVWFYLFIYVVGPFIGIWCTIRLLFTRFFWITILYYIWLFYDRATPRNGSRPNKFWRNLSLWKYYADYFPIELVKTAELPPENNYIIGSHPHGIFCFGIFASFATGGVDFSSKFPDIDPHIATLPCQFYFPLKREFILAHGLISSCAKSIENVLNGPEKGKAICIVIGGVDEFLDTRPNNYDLKLTTRKGFVKLAIRNGAWLVPAYSFGENNAYDQVANHPGTRLRKFQQGLKKYLNLSLPLFYGQGIFHYNKGIMPYKTPITTVIGKPIPVIQNPSPTQDEIDKYHDAYCRALIDLFEEHKLKYGVPLEINLNIY